MEFPGLVDSSEDGGGAARCSADWRALMSTLRRERAARGTDFPVDGMVLEFAAREPTCPRAVLAQLYEWTEEDADAGIEWAWGSHDDEWRWISPADLLIKYGHDIGKLRMTHTPEMQALYVRAELRAPGRGFALHGSIQYARAFRARLAEGSALRRFLTSIITAANAATLRAFIAALTAPGFARGLAPPGLEATYSVAPVRAGPLGA